MDESSKVCGGFGRVGELTGLVGSVGGILGTSGGVWGVLRLLLLRNFGSWLGVYGWVI